MWHSFATEAQLEAAFMELPGDDAELAEVAKMLTRDCYASPRKRRVLAVCGSERVARLGICGVASFWLAAFHEISVGNHIKKMGQSFCLMCICPYSQPDSFTVRRVRVWPSSTRTLGLAAVAAAWPKIKE